MKRLTQENIFAALLLCFFVGILILSLDYSPRARLVPVPISVLGIILLGVQLVWQNLRSPDELHVDMLEFLTRRGINPVESAEADDAPSAHAAPETPAAADEPSSFLRETFAFAKILAFVGLFMLLGPFPSAFIFTFAYLSISRHYHWAKALVVTMIFVVVVYVLFVEILDIQLYHGVLEPLVNNY
jgi:hypothetical protein